MANTAPASVEWFLDAFEVAGPTHAVVRALGTLTSNGRAIL